MNIESIRAPRGYGEKIYKENPGSVLVTTEASAHISMLRSTVKEELAFPLEQRGIDKATMESTIMSIAQALDLVDLFPAHPLHLSGGQTRRLALAVVAIVAKDLLIVEDIYEGLDQRVQKLVHTFLESLPCRVISISTEEETDGTPWVPPQRIESRGEIELSSIYARRGGRPQRLWFKAIEPSFSIGPLDLSIPRQGVLWLQGSNGSGKTTLMRSLMLDAQNSEEQKYSWQEYSYGMMLQNSLDQLIDPSLDSIFDFQHIQIPILQQQDPQEHPLDLSPALQRLVQLESAVNKNPDILIADEPDVHLGNATRPIFHERLAQFLSSGGQAIMSCHNPLFMAEVARYATVSTYSLDSLHKICE